VREPATEGEKGTGFTIEAPVSTQGKLPECWKSQGLLPWPPQWMAGKGQLGISANRGVKPHYRPHKQKPGETTLPL
ncbi:Molybdenum import ATP-binding protein ModC, partial [Clarias magur]